MYNGIAFHLLKLYHIDRENVLVTMEESCGTVALWHCGTAARHDESPRFESWSRRARWFRKARVHVMTKCRLNNCFWWLGLGRQVGEIIKDVGWWHSHFVECVQLKLAGLWYELQICCGSILIGGWVKLWRKTTFAEELNFEFCPMKTKAIFRYLVVFDQISLAAEKWHLDVVVKFIDF